ncbi:MAG: cytochrome P460 family protein [Turneriella sp.]|nr:cytochrome P460 family protein [Leptospiraceae bacterium]MCX7632226.1 cytochrome P460 family protein [Turneriella sp.]
MAKMPYFAVLASLACLITSCGEKLLTEVPYPEGYRSWTHVKSLQLKEKHPLFKDFGGLHHVYANAVGLETLKKGGSYPDGTIFVFDLLEAKSDDATMAEGARKVLGVMYKNSQVFAQTGGWGFEAFAGNTRNRLVAGKHEACFGCHASEKASDYVFSKYRE